MRGADKRIRLRFEDAQGGQSGVGVFRSLTGGQYLRHSFERAELSNASIIFVDEAADRVWRASGARAFIERNEDRYLSRIDADFDIGGKEASLVFDAWYDPATETISAELAVERAPLGDLADTFLGVGERVLSAPVTGESFD